MKIYAIEESSGEYEDTMSWIKHAFIDQDKAKEFLEDYNKKLIERRRQYSECTTCAFAFIDVDATKGITVDNLQTEGSRSCDCERLKVIKIDEDEGRMFFGCGNEVSYWSSEDTHDARIVEIELEDYDG